MSKSNGSNVTRARPIHVPGREIRSVPDDNEPSYSYEEKSFLAAEHDVEDEFLNRLSGNRRDSGGAFWRTKPAASAEPAFSSVSMMRNETDARGNGRPVVTEIQVNATERGADVSAALALLSFVRVRDGEWLYYFQSMERKEASNGAAKSIRRSSLSLL
jgi:hypothetical protein